MRKITRVTSIVVFLALTASLFFGCSGKNGSTTSTAGDDDSSKKIAIDIMRGAGVSVPSGDSDVIRSGLEKALNVSITMESNLSSDYSNQLNVRLAAGNAPDVFQVTSRQVLMDSANKGLLLELTPYLKKLTAYQKLVGKDALSGCYINSKLYAWATLPNMAYGGLWIRKDWLTNLGLKEPTTLDELAEVAKKFTQNDPDGNGKNDTYGIGGSGFGAFIDIFSGYGVPSPGSTYIKDGKVHNSLYDQGTKDALDYINKNFIKPGVFDPEIISNSGTQARDKAFQGKFGILHIDWANMTKDQYAAQIKQINPKAEWEQLAPVKGPNGAYADPVAVNNGVYTFAIPKTLEKDTAKINRILQLVNYCSEGDGLNLVQFGVKGTHYTMDSSGSITATDALAKEGAYFWVYQFAGRPDESYLKVKFAKQAQYIAFANKQQRITVYDGILDLPDGYNGSDAGTFINEQIVKFMYGQQSLSDYSKFISTLESQFDYKTYTASAEKQLKSLGKAK